MVYTGTVVTPYPQPSGTRYGGLANGTVVDPYPPPSTSGTGGTGSGGSSTPLPVPADQVSIATGIDPNEVAAATMGKIIPIWVGGIPRLGCHIIYGPTVKIVNGVALASFGVSFGMPANNLGTRELRELRLDGYKVWTLAEGALITGLTHRFYPGTETQAADPLVTAAYPGAPVAHKGQCCVFIEDLALTDYNNQVPFVSALIADTTVGDPTDGVNLGDALEQIAASPYVNLPFETVDISERVDAVIVAEKIAFIDLCVGYSRLHLWDVVQRDKLKVIERGTVAPDLTLDLTQIVADSGDNAPIVISRQQQDELARELEYSYIDIDRDYEINSVTASRPNAPVPVTVSAGKDTIALPSVHTVQEAISWATLRLYKDEAARDRVNFTTSIYGLEIEPGDVVSVDAGFKTYILRVLETLHGANWTNRIISEPVLRCAVPLSSSPLDGVACLTGAWSMSRHLVSTYQGELYTAISTAVSRISDQTGNGRHFNDAGSTTRPVVTTGGPNSRACADFDGTNHYLDTALDLSTFITNSAAYVVLSVIVDAVTLNDVDPQDNHCLIGDAGQKFGIYARNLSDLTLYGFNFDGSADAAAKDDKDLAAALVIALRHEGGNIYLRTNVGTETQVSAASGNTSDLTGDLRIAASALGLRANMKFFEAATFNCVPNEGTRDAIEENFRHWIGAVLELPPSSWTPDQLTNLIFWVKGDTLTGSDGSEVLLWSDQSGNGNNATGSAGNGPQLETAELNGMNVVRGVRANSDRLETTDFMNDAGPATAGTLIYVAKATNDSGVTAGSLVEFSAQFLAPAFYPHADGNIYDAFGSNAQKTVGNPGDLTQWHISGFTSATNDWKYYFNATQFFSTGTNTVAWDDAHGFLFVSDASGGTTQYGDGWLAEVILTTDVLSTSDRQKVEGYLAHKWGITSVLPSDHPYKTTPP